MDSPSLHSCHQPVTWQLAAATPMAAQYFLSKVLHLRHTVVESEEALLETNEQAVEKELGSEGQCSPSPLPHSQKSPKYKLPIHRAQG